MNGGEQDGETQRATAMPSSVRVSRFSTTAFPERERYQRWVERDWPSLAPLLETKPGSRLGFFAETVTVTLPGLTLVEARMSGLSYERDRNRLTRDGVDHFGLCLMLEGEAVVDAAGREARLTSGSVWIGDLAQPYRWRSNGSRAITLSMPRAHAERILPSVAGLHGRALHGAQSAAFSDPLTALWPHLSRDGLNSAAAAPALLHLLDAALGNVGPRAETPAEALKIARLAQVERLIGELCVRPDLNPAEIARRAGLSRAALYRLFNDRGGVGAAIRAARLERLRNMLADVRETRQIAQLAYDAGFLDPGAAARMFRTAFGCSPGEYRAQAWTSALR